jgi:transglutaminase-like putative cysteine protease
MRATDRTWIAVVVAGLLAALTLQPLTADSGYLFSAGLLMALYAVIAIVGERLRLSKAGVTLTQLLVSALVIVSLAVGPGDPDLSWWRRIGPLVVDGVEHMRESAAPMPPNAGVRIIFAAVVAGMTLIAGVLADWLERPSLTLAPLVTLFAIPAIALRTGVGWGPFLLIAAGYLAILFADGVTRHRLWPRRVTSDEGSAGAMGGAGGIWRLGAVIAIPALVLSIVLGLVLPIVTTSLFTSLRQGGTGPVEMTDPQLDLRRNLQQPDNRQVLTYRTSKETGTYLRMTTLPSITPDGWVQSRVNLRQGGLGPVPGLAAAPAGAARTTNIQTGDLRSMYLPAPYAPRSHNAKGEWSYDPASLMVMATGPDRQTATQNLTYTVESWDVEPKADQLATARAGTPTDPTTLQVPSDVPASITELTTLLTQYEPTPARKAASIQAYLRTFTYSVQGASGATNYKAMETFLIQTKTGYCIQFAGSMALMARIAGIPSRVAIGFLPGARQQDTWVVGTHDMHAWPELYFEGYGWVRYEPTPNVAVPPSWSDLPATQPIPSESSVPEPSLETSPEPTTTASTPVDEPSGGADPAAALAFGVFRGIGLTLLAAAVLLMPWFIRRRLRTQRLADADDPYEAVDAAWSEVRDTWIDLGRTWPQGSVREIGAAMAKVIGEGEPREALRRLVVAVERSRYAAAIGDLPDLRADITSLIATLEDPLTWDGRLLARFRPRSLFQAWRSRAEQALASVRARAAVRSARASEVVAVPDESAYQRP